MENERINALAKHLIQKSAFNYYNAELGQYLMTNIYIYIYIYIYVCKRLVLLVFLNKVTCVKHWREIFLCENIFSQAFE